MTSFDELVAQATAAPFSGWDFAWLDARCRQVRLPWRYSAEVTSRHESFRADEVSRVLAPGGSFVTQQVDNHSDDDLYRLLGLEPPDVRDSWLPLATRQLTEAGLTVTKARSGQEIQYFSDIGTVVYYLRVVSWAIAGYSLDRFRPQLRAAFETKSLWPLPVRHRRFLVVARRTAQ